MPDTVPTSEIPNASTFPETFEAHKIICILLELNLSCPTCVLRIFAIDHLQRMD